MMSLMKLVRMWKRWDEARDSSHKTSIAGTIEVQTFQISRIRKSVRIRNCNLSYMEYRIRVVVWMILDFMAHPCTQWGQTTKWVLANDFESEIVMFMQNYLWFFIHRFWIEYVFTETFVILVKKIDFNKLRFMIFKLCRHDWLNIVLRVIVMTLKDVLKLNRHWIFHTKSIRNKNKTLFQIITE